MFYSQSASRLPSAWWQADIADIAALTPVEQVLWPALVDAGVELAIKRDDLLHPSLSGNKFYKLMGHVRAFLASGQAQWLTFGGAYSNHLHAFATASAELEIPAIAIIRGERPAQLSATLLHAETLGVRLRFVSRADYASKDQPQRLAAWRAELGDFYCVPEGGSGTLGALGCALWVQQALAMAPWTPSALCLAAGTGCTAAGALAGAGVVPLHAYLALKGNPQSTDDFSAAIVDLAAKTAELRGIARQLPALVLECNYHCGGYARFPAYLREFMRTFEQLTQVPLDPVYTAKLMWGIDQQLRTGVWPRGSKILVLHTGGLQGRAGFSGL